MASILLVCGVWFPFYTGEADIASHDFERCALVVAVKDPTPLATS